MTEETKESDAFFDHFSQENKATDTGMRLVKALAMKIFKFANVTPESSVLEIGPGRGIFADICLEKGVDYFAVEANRQMAETLERKGAGVVKAMVPPLPELDRQFDVAVMINVLEHMNSAADALQTHTTPDQRWFRQHEKLSSVRPDARIAVLVVHSAGGVHAFRPA